MKKILYTALAASFAMAILPGCEEDKFQDGLKIGDMTQIYASNGDINRAAFKRANEDGSMATAFSGASLTGFLPMEQAYVDAGFINTESTADADPVVLREILLYHLSEGAKKASELSTGDLQTLAPGKKVSVSNATVVNVNGIGNQDLPSTLIGTDAHVANGYVHTIDRLLLPSPRTLTDITEQNGYFDLFEAALKRADLDETLSGAGPFTVFAPGDPALTSYLGIATKDGDGKDRSRAVVQDEALAAIAALTPAALEELVSYHIVEGQLESGDFTAGSLETLNGGSVTIALEKGILKSITGVNNSTASVPMKADVAGINGVMHIIDRVLKP